ncbi:hypothetical protein LTS18_013569, partial [Coniosporium uncinatum]
MELLIMISACKSGSAKSITAVVPYFPYSRQSKKKSHRGAITARMLANLLHVAGVNHVITLDLHASQMQGFFKCPVDNLVAEPLIARWIRHNIPNWQNAVVVSKNAGGTKRVTSLADALKLSFGIVTTDRRKHYRQYPDYSLMNSTILSQFGSEVADEDIAPIEEELGAEAQLTPTDTLQFTDRTRSNKTPTNVKSPPARSPPRSNPQNHQSTPKREPFMHPLMKSMSAPMETSDPEPPSPGSASTKAQDPERKDSDEVEYFDERARDVIHGRLVHGHIVDEDHPSPALSAMSTSTAPRIRHTNTSSSSDEPPANMTASFLSTKSNNEHFGLGGTGDAGATSDEEEEDLKNPDLETHVTLVGDVRDRPVFIVDDMIDKAGSWIAAAETVVKRGGATKVYCFATHALFSENGLEEMED